MEGYFIWIIWVTCRINTLTARELHALVMKDESKSFLNLAVLYYEIYSPGFDGRCPLRLCVFQYNLFNLHTFRPWLYCLIWGEMPLFHIGSMSWNTRFMAHLSELGLKTDTRAVTVRHRARRRRGGTACQHMVGISALFFRRNPETGWVWRLNQAIFLSEDGKSAVF